MPVFCLFTLGRHGNFTAGVTMEQSDLLCTALALNIELLSIIVCAVLQTSYQNEIQSLKKYVQFGRDEKFSLLQWVQHNYSCSKSTKEAYRAVTSLRMGTLGSCPGGPMLIYFLMFKHLFCWTYQYNKYMFNFIDHLYFLFL